MTAASSHGFYSEYHPKKTPTIVMIHGFRGTHHGLDRIATALPQYHSIVPDIPGFGEGATLQNYSLEAYVEWLHDFITALELPEPPILLGHSFGSIISAAYAARFPETIEKLILVNPIGAPALEGPRGFLTKAAILYYTVGEKLPSRLAHTWLAAKPVVRIMSVAMAKTKDKNERRFIHAQHDQYFSRFHTAASVSEAFRTSTSNSVRDVAAAIPVHTLLVAGEIDDITPLAKQKELAELFPNAQLVSIPRVGHLTHYETPSEVAQFIRDFIA